MKLKKPTKTEVRTNHTVQAPAEDGLAIGTIYVKTDGTLVLRQDEQSKALADGLKQARGQ